ncbi:MAG: hypothetical protein ACUVT3_02665 [Ignavibacterium sp.]|uniref:hypothetical protein n=1 Tax=Ignavibacterium sp. TaxID=2651167 RepID=UPI00404B44F8
MTLRKRAFGLSIGVVMGLSFLFLTWFLLWRNSPGEIMSKFSSVFYGYSYSWLGGIIGFIWGFVVGFIVGVLIAWFYDLFSKMLYKEK